MNSPIGTVTVGSTPYQVFPVSPFSIVYSYGKIGYFNQLNQNFQAVHRFKCECADIKWW
ncbi:MAG: hypothetical protein IPP73_17365 [Chitinophagaceae bacterium]|nr:hypothetical protein [Chitinophagaceae bacterium]